MELDLQDTFLGIRKATETQRRRVRKRENTLEAVVGVAHVELDLRDSFLYDNAMRQQILTLLTILVLQGCTQADLPLPPWHTINGRDAGESIVRYPIYRAYVPETWRCVPPPPSASIADTTLPLCEFFIDDPLGSIRIAIHNFPADSVEERIPPTAQVARWQRQLALTSPTESQTTPIAFGGFAGLQLEADGILAWAMQLSSTHFRSLQLAGSSEELLFLRQMRADYTIKATGPKASLQAHRDAIFAFANSFELIQEIPSSL